MKLPEGRLQKQPEARPESKDGRPESKLGRARSMEGRLAMHEPDCRDAPRISPGSAMRTTSMKWSCRWATTDEEV